MSEKFIKRFEKLTGVIKAYYLPNKLHLTIFYNELVSKQLIKKIVLKEIEFSAFNNSVETLSFYPEITRKSCGDVGENPHPRFIKNQVVKK